jgi:hypothetical protein
MATLIGQGLTLGPLLSVLGLAQSERHHACLDVPFRREWTYAGH